MSLTHTNTHMCADPSCYLGDHVHAHGVPRGAAEADVQISSSLSDQQLLESSKPEADARHTGA